MDFDARESRREDEREAEIERAFSEFGLATEEDRQRFRQWELVQQVGDDDVNVTIEIVLTHTATAAPAAR